MSPTDPFGYERGPEADVGQLEKELESVRQRAEPLVEELAAQLRLTEDDVRRLAVVLFGQYLDLTRAKDTFILVVKGTVTPYDNALQVLVASDEESRGFSALIEHLEIGLEDGNDSA